MTFEEYRLEGQLGYAAFVVAIRHILEAAVYAQQIVPHAITGRAKQPKSLSKKLVDNGVDPESAIEEAIKDLAGARIVFLTNGQVAAFNNTGILHDNFEVVSVNVHHPVPGTETETKLFDSTNYLVRLKPERLALPEYQPFEGLRAEIQVQTLLNHAWAEMGHDTIYKQPNLQHVGQTRLEAIKARMDKVMRDYLLPAGHDFDKIARDFSQLVQADESVEETVAIVTASTDNNELADAIGKLDDLILPHFDDRASQFVKLVPMLIDAVERTRGSDAALVETVFGNYPGKGGDDIARKAADLLGDHLYYDPALTFATLVQLFIGAATDVERKIWVDLASTFSKHDLAIWKAYGPAVPRLILDEIGKLEPEQVQAGRGLLLEMLGNILSAELGGTSWNSMSVTIHQSSVPVSDVLRALRAEAITVLEGLLDAALDDPGRREILSELRNASMTPYHGGNDDLMRMVMEDGARVIAIEKDHIGGWGLELRRWCETDALHCHYRFQALPPHLADNAQLVIAQQAVVAELFALRDALNADPEFVLYKTLIGHDSVRPSAWDEQPFDPDATNAWREARYSDIVDQITEDSVGAWIERVRLYVAEPKSTGGELVPLADCLKLLGETKPQVGARFLDVMDDALSSLLIALLLGIEASGQGAIGPSFIWRWIGEGRFLANLAEYLRWQRTFDPDMLIAVAARAIEFADDHAILGSLNTAANRFDKTPDQRLIDDVFMPAIGYVTDAGKPNWVFGAWGFHRGALLSSLDEGQAQRLLQSFVEVAEIDYRADQVLTVVADRFPALVFAFFETRMYREREKNGDRFDPIPFQLHQLQRPLSREPAMLLDATRRWYAREPLYHEFRGGRLIGNVFSKLSPEVTASLVEVVKTGDRDDLAFVLTTLLAYDGDEQVYPLCMDAVDRLEEKDEWLARVSSVLGKTGVVSGEFGFVEAEAAQRARLERWRGDRRPKVQAYVTEQLRQIDQSMAWQQRRAEWDVEQRKRDWGEA